MDPTPPPPPFESGPWGREIIVHYVLVQIPTPPFESRFTQTYTMVIALSALRIELRSCRALKNSVQHLLFNGQEGMLGGPRVQISCSISVSDLFHDYFGKMSSSVHHNGGGPLDSFGNKFHVSLLNNRQCS